VYILSYYAELQCSALVYILFPAKVYVSDNRQRPNDPLRLIFFNAFMYIIGVNITDSAREAFQREKLIPFLKNVTHSISNVSTIVNYNSLHLHA
jgi:flagellar biosynthesis regulator FlbT